MKDRYGWYLLIAAALLIALLYLLGPVLTPFALAFALAYLSNPWVNRMARYITRGGAIAVVYLWMAVLLGLIFGIVLPLLEQQIEELVVALPGTLQAFLQQWGPLLQSRFGVDISTFNLDSVIDTLRANWGNASGIMATVVAAVSRSGKAIVTWIAIAFLTPVIMFYALRDWDKFWHNAADLLPRWVEPTVISLAREIDEVLGAFLRGQLVVMSTLAVIYSVGLTIIGLKYGILIGIVSGFLNFIPYLGVGLGLSVAVIVAIFQFDSWAPILGVVGVFGLGQATDAVFLTPYLIGERIGLHPLAVIFAVLAGGQLFGVIGVLIALPSAAAAAVLLRHGHRRYRQSKLYQ